VWLGACHGLGGSVDTIGTIHGGTTKFYSMAERLFHFLFIIWFGEAIERFQHIPAAL